MKFVEARALADTEVAARKIVELANAVEPYLDNRILIEKVNGPFLYELRGTPAEVGLDRAIEKGWLVLHESGTFVKFTQARRGPIRVNCTRCHNCRWVCETHQIGFGRDRAHAAEGPAPGDPCPVCYRG
jgi:hypothetical protein